MASQGRRRLCIDFGTSNTAAAFRVDTADPVVVPLSADVVTMPSAVGADGGNIVVGSAARAIRLHRPDAYEESPKSRLVEGEIELGDRFWPVEEIIGVVLDHVHRTALRYSGFGSFDTVILTHPDNWSERRQAILRSAAQRGGIRPEQIRTVSESLAAAWYYVHQGHDVAANERMCVFDFGAGTCDVAVLAHDSGGFTVIGSGGDNTLGGNDLDARLRRWVLEEAGRLDPELPALLREPAAALALGDHVRIAKENLSEDSRTSIELPGGRRPILLTRREFEEMIAPYVQRAVDLTRQAIEGADAVSGRASLPVVYLTGGTSNIPGVAAALSGVGRIGRIGDPKTVVAQGGLLRSTNIDVPVGTAAVPAEANPFAATGVRIMMPALAPGTVVAGVLAREGQRVRTGEPIARVQSAATPVLITAPADGVLSGVDLVVGATVAPGAVFGAIGPTVVARDRWAGLHRVPAGVVAENPATRAQPPPPPPAPPPAPPRPGSVPAPKSALPFGEPRTSLDRSGNQITEWPDGLTVVRMPDGRVKVGRHGSQLRGGTQGVEVAPSVPKGPADHIVVAFDDPER
ncbi:Hsp70 family protein [Gordonia sp. VNQ95]|uniref:Hsp70 family protein n=1 Tax=Gordonia TaxID=2053 RepID=UPI0032B604D7